MAQYCEDGRFQIMRSIWPNAYEYRHVPNAPRLGWGAAFDGTEANCIQKYGYSTVICDIGSLNYALSLGYHPFNIIIAFADYSYPTAFNTAISKGVSLFYLDEPVLTSKMELLFEATAFAQSIGGQVLTSESAGQEEWLDYPSRVHNLSNSVKIRNPKPLVGNHTFFHQGAVLGADPRTQWSYLRQELGEIFNFAWIRLTTAQSYDELGLLLGHARNLGGIHRLIGGTWVGEPPGYPTDPDHRTEDLARQAWGYGHLQMLQKEYQQKWCCPTQTFDPDECEMESQSLTGYQRYYPDPPNPPELLPAPPNLTPNGTQVTGGSTLLQWGSLAGMEYYWVIYADNPNFINGSSVRVYGNQELADALNPNTNYYWSVQGVKSNGIRSGIATASFYSL